MKPTTAMLRLLLSIAFLAGLALPVSAQRSTSAAGDESEDADARARELFHLGDDLYAQGRYEEALAAFEEAYELSERPLLLFNIANAQERSGRWEEAIASLRAYLPHAEEAERSRIESRIESLERRVARLRQEEAPTPAQPPPPQPRNVVAPVVLASGGAVLAGGVVLAILARGARQDIDDACRPVDGRRLCPADVSDSVDRDRRMSLGADALFVASAAALGVGLWLLLRGDGEDEGAVEASVGAGPTGGEVVLRGRF